MKYRHRVLGLLCLLAAITYLDRVAISVAGPRIQDSLHISPEAWGWVVGVFTLSYGIFEIPICSLQLPGLLGACGNVCGGFLSDSLVRRFGLKCGRRSVGFIGLLIAALCTIATILTTNKFASLLFLGLVYAGITLQQTVIVK